jgi:hypothetical protein
MPFPHSIFGGYDHAEVQPMPSPLPQIENLDLADLLKNPHVQAMYSSWKEASSQVVQSAQLQQTLIAENRCLNAEVEAYCSDPGARQ